MKWRGRTLKTYGDIMRHGIDKCKTPEEARKFMALYRKETVHAAPNIGYMSGYYDSANMRSIQECFQVSHPIFGSYEPTPEEALETGKRMARRI
jgi:flagellar biosynthesis GTPase FlhF